MHPCAGPRRDAQDKGEEVAVFHLRLRGRHTEQAARAHPRRPQRVSGKEWHDRFGKFRPNKDNQHMKYIEINLFTF